MATPDEQPATPPEQTTETPPVAPQEQPQPVPKRDPVGLHYRRDGDRFFEGVPRRDLTVRELVDLEPATLRNITADGPGGKPLYEMTKAGTDAWEAARG